MRERNGNNNDKIKAGHGDDELNGGNGADKFKCVSRYDTVTDFDETEGIKQLGTVK